VDARGETKAGIGVVDAPSLLLATSATDGLEHGGLPASASLAALTRTKRLASEVRPLASKERLAGAAVRR
jgi:hypothetical protein